MPGRRSPRSPADLNKEAVEGGQRRSKAVVKRQRRDRHHVYVIELAADVLQHHKFRAANPHRNSAKCCLYVGMTGLTPDIRFERHKAGVKDNSYVRLYGLKLRPDLYAELNPLPYKEAQRMEKVLARELRNDGYAVWQK